MDIATLIGLILGVIMVIFSIISGKGDIMAFVNIPGFILVIGGSFSSTMISFPLSEVKKIMGITMKVFLNKQKDILIIINQLVSLAESARRDGLLALEGRLEEIDEPFLALGIRMAVDGMSAEIVDAIMRTEMEAIEFRHEVGKQFYDAFGRYAPAYGMLGTVVGLVIMLAHMDPETIGPGMAMCLITTFYGAIAANIFCLPFVDKLVYYNSREILSMEIMVRGVIAIQAGENPRVVKQKLMTFIPPKFRPEEEEQA